MPCLEAGHILSNGLKITNFCFLLSQRRSNVNTGGNWVSQRPRDPGNEVDVYKIIYLALFSPIYLEFAVWFQISFMSRTCDLHDSCGVNIATYLWDNL